MPSLAPRDSHAEDKRRSALNVKREADNETFPIFL